MYSWPLNGYPWPWRIKLHCHRTHRLHHPLPFHDLQRLIPIFNP